MDRGWRWGIADLRFVLGRGIWDEEWRFGFKDCRFGWGFGIGYWGLGVWGNE